MQITKLGLGEIVRFVIQQTSNKYKRIRLVELRELLEFTDFNVLTITPKQQQNQTLACLYFKAKSRYIYIYIYVYI